MFEPKMIFIKSGQFMMGSDNGWDDEKPIHEVNIVHPFMMGQYPVMFKEFDAFCTATGHKKPHDEGWGRGNRPVINVSWHDAVDYCAWLSQQTGKTYRLPNEAEWEYACRAGSQGDYCFGDDPANLGDYAWYEGNSGGKTHPVGEKLPNAFDIYDMHGNVWEWCADRWHDNYRSAPTDGSALESGICRDRLLRGGSWCNGPDRMRSANRIYGMPRPPFRFYDVGFRVVREP